MLHLVTRRKSFKVASFFTLVFALITGGAAAATGYQDYREIPEGTDAKRLANAHGMLNVGVLGAVALQLLLRSTGRVGLFVRLLNLAAARASSPRAGTGRTWSIATGCASAAWTRSPPHPRPGRTPASRSPSASRRSWTASRRPTCRATSARR